MRRIIMREARPGMRVARHVADPRKSGETAVAAGTSLSVDHIIRMHELGVYDLWVDDEQLSYLEALYKGSDARKQRLIGALMRSFQTLGGMGLDAVTHPFMKRNRLQIEETMVQLVESAAALPCFGALVESDELLQHSATVAVVATILGLHLEDYLIDQRRRLNCRQAKDVVNLAIGALYHDVGETLLPPEQRESKALLSLDFLGEHGEDWKQHTHLGYQALRKHLDPTAAAVVLHHHQHFDGSGFAMTEGRTLSQSGKHIHVFARIALAADLFCHLVSDPESGLPHPAAKALWRLQQTDVRPWIDPMVMRSLLALVPRFAVGMVVLLSDRRPGIVTRVDERAGYSPQVQMLRDLEEEAAPSEEIDLATQRDFWIAEAGGDDVTECTAGARCAEPLVAA